ncbi:MAG: DUF1697 domain-containing protein [Candidatus Saccharimonadales bacterium]
MKYIILLRGVNVGGRTIKSPELKSCFEKVGFENVQTVLATGNVIIESNDKPEKLKLIIEKSLTSSFSYQAQVCVLSVEKLSEIVANYPFKDASAEYHRYVIFKDETPDAAALAAVKLEDKLESIQTGDHVIYWRVLKGHTLDSDFAKQSAKTATKIFSTTRNLNTLERILQKA